MAYLAKHRSKADSTKHDPTTKGIIVKNALAYFAKYGIEGTTLSQIREASGQSNRSAIHYHFGGKDGLLRAVCDYIRQRLQPEIANSIRLSQQLCLSGSLTIEAVVQCLGHPFTSVFQEDTDGQHCILVLSHLTHETDPAKVNLVVEILEDLISATLEHLEKLLPDIPVEKRNTVMCLCLIQLIESLSMSPLLAEQLSPLGRNGLRTVYPEIIYLSTKFASAGLIAAAM